MAARLVVTPDAEDDLAEAYSWYESRQVGLGDDFLNAIDACLDSIRLHPAVYAVVYRGCRRCIAKRFPYAVLYQFHADTVTVYAVLHTSRDPRVTTKRLP